MEILYIFGMNALNAVNGVCIAFSWSEFPFRPWPAQVGSLSQRCSTLQRERDQLQVQTACMKHSIQKEFKLKRNSLSLLVVFFSFSLYNILNSVDKQSQASFTNDVARLSVQLEDFSAMKRIRESRNLLFDCRRISEKWRTPGYSKHQCQTIETRWIPESAALLGWLTHWMWCVLRRFLQILHVWSRV